MMAAEGRIHVWYKHIRMNGKLYVDQDADGDFDMLLSPRTADRRVFQLYYIIVTFWTRKLSTKYLGKIQWMFFK